MFDSIPQKVQKTAQSLGYNLSDNRIEDIAFKVATSYEVVNYSSLLDMKLILKDIRSYLIFSVLFFGVGVIYPTGMNTLFNQDINSPRYREQNFYASLDSGYLFFRGSLLCFVIIELQYIFFNLYKENQATQKMILYFLQKKVDIQH